MGKIQIKVIRLSDIILTPTAIMQKMILVTLMRKRLTAAQEVDKSVTAGQESVGITVLIWTHS